MKKVKISITNQIIIAVIVGITLGVIFGEKLSGIKIIGDIFLRLIQMSVVLLIMGAVIESVGSLDPGELGRLGIRIIFWFMLSTLVAATIGLALGEVFRPGVGMDLSAGDSIGSVVEKDLGEIILDFFPSNIIKAMADTNMIQVILFAILFGVAIGILQKQKETFRLLGGIKEFNEVILKMVHMVMKLAPVGIGALMVYTTGTMGVKVMIPLTKFLLVFGLGALLHLLLCIVGTSVYCKTKPMRVIRKLTNMSIVAFTTTSSAITLPTKMADSEKKLGVSTRISRLVNPLGMTLNSNGLSMYLALACITIAQIYGMELEFMAIVKVVLLSTLACLGTVVVPGGGLVALTIVIPSLGLPIESIAMLAGIDWFSGMFRTVLNVDIDALIAMVIAKDVKELDYEILNGTIGH